MSDSIDADGFRANVGIILCNTDREVFWAGRAGRRGWQFPQGGINPGETAEQAMFRELGEEVGLSAGDVELLGATDGWLRYRLPRRYRRRSAPKCIGQKQRWFLLELTCDETAVQLDCTDSPEFDRWCWVDYWYPLKKVIFFKRRVYERALEQLSPLIFPNGVPARAEAARRSEIRLV